MFYSAELYIEREDFMENAPPKYFRMTPGADVRLKHAYILHCTGVKKIMMEIYLRLLPHIILTVNQVKMSPVSNRKAPYTGSVLQMPHLAR